MSLRRWKSISVFPLILLLFLLAACGGSVNTPPPTPTPTPTPTPIPPTPTPGPGQQILAKVTQELSTAQTLHGIFNITIVGPTINGTVNTEIWTKLPNKNRTLVLQSTVSAFAAGSLTVTDGKQVWQYDPVHKVVYTGPVTPTDASSRGSVFGAGNQQSQFILGLVQSILTNSKATLASSSANINGHTAYDVRIVPGGQATPTSPGSDNGPSLSSLDYDGHVYVDKTTGLPLQVKLMLQSFGQITLDLPTLMLNQPLADSLFTFVPPADVKVLPLQQATPTPSTGSLTFAQAQQQAGYHLLSIPGTETSYELQGVNALGAPGNQIYTLNYNMGNLTFTITEGKSLANLPNASGQQVSLRGTTGSLSTQNGTGQTTLVWTEKGVGIQIVGKLSNDQIIAIANLLT